ncbi:aromatic acid/H+ symport family MFS transporter [Glutamicibacter sp.]|uniref:MFS transporter n=1 Tax=Glutamicibacter sp. TaxID=1931995 RepID=UPI0028BD6616|nr:aromatic acid/H+ symport family MFS transporter [Glutamicibacter sp.]
MSTSIHAKPLAAKVSSKTAFFAVLACWLLVVFDGYDLIVYGTVQKALLNEGWGLNDATLGTIGSLAFLGMLIGALLAGRLSDTLGRRKTILSCAALFSVLTVLCAFAPNAMVFGGLRLLAGIGLGGLVPSVNAMVAELVPERWRSGIATLMMSGVPVGGSIASLLGMGIVPNYGWQPMFVIGGAALVIVLPIAWATLPETMPATTHTKAGFGAQGFGALLQRKYVVASMVFAIANLATLFAWYGLATWLPKLMTGLNYDLGSALVFGLVLNLGAVAGSVITAWAGDKFGPALTGAVAAALAGVGLGVIITHPPVGVVYAMLVLAGIGTHGTAALIIAAVANYYPHYLRGTALGWTTGVGRIGAVLAPQAAGLMLQSGFGESSNFLLFALGAGCSAALLLVTAVLTKSKTA